MISPIDEYGNEQGSEAGEYQPRIVVRLQDNIALSVDEVLRQVLEKYHLQVNTSDTKENSERLQALVERAQRRAAERGREIKTPSLSTYYYLEAQEGKWATKGNLLEAVEELSQLKGTVEQVYIHQVGPDPLVDPRNEPRFLGQTYLGPAPDGINAQCAWAAGGDGANVKFIDLEGGWTLNHEDLAHLNAQVFGGAIKNKSRQHGTAVLGIVCAALNQLGGVGVAPRVAHVDVASHFSLETPFKDMLYIALIEAFSRLDSGDVLLIETQVKIVQPGRDIYGPVDVYPQLNEVIYLGCQAGIIVVEAGGNGTDGGQGNGGQIPPLNLDTRNFVDSGAIIVSAATSTHPHTRLDYAPHGDRIDCYAWGENINTCFADASGALLTGYRPDPTRAEAAEGFNGTSGAAAIIAGAMVALQSIAKARGLALNGCQWRERLRNPAFGTPPAAGELPIGVMPDLCKIIDGLPPPPEL